MQAAMFKQSAYIGALAKQMCRPPVTARANIFSITLTTGYVTSAVLPAEDGVCRFPRSRSCAASSQHKYIHIYTPPTAAVRPVEMPCMVTQENAAKHRKRGSPINSPKKNKRFKSFPRSGV
jgi:hypothetical protein